LIVAFSEEGGGMAIQGWRSKDIAEGAVEMLVNEKS
jgi:hypothetical protein